MPVIQGSKSISANSTDDNVLSGSQFEFLPFDAAIEFGFTGSATGLKLDVYSGQDVLAEDMAPSEQNRVPLRPDDFTLTDVAAAGERLKVRARNTTAGSLTLRWSIVISPIG